MSARTHGELKWVSRLADATPVVPDTMMWSERRAQRVHRSHTSLPASPYSPPSRQGRVPAVPILLHLASMAGPAPAQPPAPRTPATIAAAPPSSHASAAAAGLRQSDLPEREADALAQLRARAPRHAVHPPLLHPRPHDQQRAAAQPKAQLVRGVGVAAQQELARVAQRHGGCVRSRGGGGRGGAAIMGRQAWKRRRHAVARSAFCPLPPPLAACSPLHCPHKWHACI